MSMTTQVPELRPGYIAWMKDLWFEQDPALSTCYRS